jgi:hypothetical protein
VHEDRPANLVGLRLAVLSLVTAHPTARVVVSAPTSPELDAWCRRTTGHGLLGTATAKRGWDVKPELLLHLLDREDTPVVWVDADVLCARSPEALLDLPQDEMVVCEETWWSRAQGTDARTVGWGWPVGRHFPTSANTAVLRVTRQHRPVLHAWRDAVSSAEYLAAQARPWFQRPIHLMGDQEPLSGLLGSTRFSDVPLRFLRRGQDIAQCFGASGYTVAERWRSRRELPAFVHAQSAPKPWAVTDDDSLLQRWHAELNPYTILARRMLDEDEEPWLRRRSAFGDVCRGLTNDHPALAELPLAAVEEVGRRARQQAGRAKRAVAAQRRGSAGLATTR